MSYKEKGYFTKKMANDSIDNNINNNRFTQCF